MTLRTANTVISTSLRATSFDGAFLERTQKRRVSRLVQRARIASPYFRRLLRDFPDTIDDWTSVPATRKADLMAHFDDWVTDPRLRRARIEFEFLSRPELLGHKYLNRYHVFTTSGTTGEPAIIVHDPTSWITFQLVSRLRSELQVFRHGAFQGMLSKGFRSAALFATGGHYGGAGVAAFVQQIHPMLSRRLRVVSVLRPISDQVRELNSFQPTFISGYPSALLALASQQRLGHLKIAPALMLCAGEHLSDLQRQELEQTFSCHLLQGYAATEVPGLALECDEHRFHINSDWYVLEPVDENGTIVPAGTPSASCLVTNLSNFVQPIIRYDLGDRIFMHPDPCPCGSRLPSVDVEGRTNDVITLQDSHGSSVEITPLALGAIIEETPGVHRFQVLNPDTHHLLVRFDESLRADRDLTWETLRDRVHEYMAKQGVADLTLELDEGRPQVESSGGKLRQVISS